MLLVLLLVFAQARNPGIQNLDPKETVQVTGRAPRRNDRETNRQAALAEALRAMVEACAGKVSENVPDGTATHWRGQFGERVRVVAHMTVQKGEVKEDTTRVEVTDAKGATLVMETGLGKELKRKLDPAVVDEVFGKDSSTRFKVVREYEADKDFVVELAYVAPRTAGDLLPISPGRSWTWKWTRRWPGNESATVKQEFTALVEKVQKGVALVRLNRQGQLGSDSVVVEVDCGAKGPLVLDVDSSNGKKTAQFRTPGATETTIRWMTEQLQEGTMPGLFASLPGHTPFKARDAWGWKWEGKTAEGQVSYEEEAKLGDTESLSTPVGPRSGLKLTRTGNEVLRIDLGAQGTRILQHKRTWEILYADGVGCVRSEVKEVETSSTQAKDGTVTAPTTSEIDTLIELTACTGAK